MKATRCDQRRLPGRALRALAGLILAALVAYADGGVSARQAAQRRRHPDARGRPRV
jgi:hypothetical protein